MRAAGWLLNGWLLVLELGGLAWLLLGEEPRAVPTHSSAASARPIPRQAILPAAPAREEVGSRSRELPARALPFFGRLVAADGGAPIPGAHVTLCRPCREIIAHRLATHVAIVERATSNADGGFAFARATARGMWGRVEAAGFTTAEFRVEPGTTPGAPRSIALGRPARALVTALNAQHVAMEGIVVRFRTADGNDAGAGRDRRLLITGRGEPRTDAAVLATKREGSTTGREPTDDDDPMEWEGETDEHGQCRFDDLPASVPLGVTLLRKDVPMDEEEEDTFTLEPGEQRSIVLTLAGGIALRGRMIDQDGRAVAGQPVCLGEVRPAIAKARANETAREYRTSTTQGSIRARTDDEGRFAIEDLWVGTYEISPAAGTHVAPLAELVTIGTEPSGEIELRVTRERFIRGHVLTPLGKPLPSAVVQARSPSVLGQIIASCDRDGRFRLGPLPESEFELRASGPPVSAHSGDEDIVLHAQSGSCLEGTIVDAASGERCEATVVQWQTARERYAFGSGPFPRSEVASQDGRFGLTASPGRHGLFAWSADGRVALATDLVLDEQSAGEVVLRMQPGAQLRIRYDGDSKWAAFFVARDRALLFQSPIAPGETVVRPGPEGLVTVHVLEYRGGFGDVLRDRPDAGRQSRTVSLVPGESTLVTFGPPPR